MGRSVFASVAVPIFPYVPPSDVVQMDLLFNIFGLTKPAIEDDVKRLQGYWKLIEMVMGASAEVTKSKIEKMFDDARTTRAWEIDPDTISALNQIGAQVITSGIDYEQQAPVVGISEAYASLMTWSRIDENKLPRATFENMAQSANTTFGVGKWVVYGIYSQYRSDYAIIIGFASKDNTMVQRTGSFTIGGASFSNAWTINGGTQSYQCLNWSYARSVNAWNPNYRNNTAIGTDNYFSGYGMTYDKYTGQAVMGNASVSAQNAQIADALVLGGVIPITAQTTLVNGQIDDTKPARIHLPASLPIPAESVADLPAVQEKMGVVPISEDVTDTVEQLQQQQAQISGDTGAYALDLTGYFPFCIPFDIGNLLGAFVAEPEAPVIPFIFPVGYEDGQIIMETYYMDLSVFDTVAYWCRKGELALFVIGLGVVTRQWFLRG